MWSLVITSLLPPLSRQSTADRIENPGNRGNTGPIRKIVLVGDYYKIYISGTTVGWVFLVKLSMRVSHGITTTTNHGTTSSISS
jgi:hypothetical protein